MIQSLKKIDTYIYIYYIYTYIHVYTYIHTYIHVYIHRHTYTYIHIHVHIMLLEPSANHTPPRSPAASHPPVAHKGWGEAEPHMHLWPHRYDATEPQEPQLGLGLGLATPLYRPYEQAAWLGREILSLWCWPTTITMLRGKIGKQRRRSPPATIRIASPAHAEPTIYVPFAAQ